MDTTFEKADPQADGRRPERSASAFALTAHRHALVESLLGIHASTLRELARGLGSPLHMVLPQVFRENVRRLQDVFVENGMEGTILYAKKANKADCFARASADLGIGVDVASQAELARTLACGVPGEHIGLSGPEKCDQLLTLALRHRCLIAVDSLSELRRMVPLAAHCQTAARILLRVRPDSQRSSRFGLTAHECDMAFYECVKAPGRLQLEGFSFHLGGYSLAERVQAANALIEMCSRAQTLGLRACRQVDIGGGLPVQYVDPERWSEFLRLDASGHYHANKSFGGFYPYGVASHGAQALHDLLNAPVDAGTTLVDKARRLGIGFIVEPGRALLDQAGFTLFRVQGVKDRHATDGYAIVTVQGSSLSLSEQWFNSEYLPDPVLLGDGLGVCDAHPAAFLSCVGGSTCLESDMVTWRKVGFPRAIAPGDHLVYLNTAGYQMDSNESPFHDVPLPLKVVMEQHGSEAAPRWCLDENAI